MRFTDRGIQALKPRSERYEIWEDGRTGLGLRVSPAGRKSWLYMYRFDRKPRRMTLGVFPSFGLADAHIAHANAKAKLAVGTDPGLELIESRRAARDASTVEGLIDEYLKRHARPNKRSAGADERLFRKDVLPVWGRRKASSITRRDVITLLDRIVDRGSGVMANRTLSTLRRVWNFGLDRDLVDATPFTRIRPPTKESARDKILSPDEILRFWTGLDLAHMTPGTRLALKLILATAQRRAEVVMAPWSEFDLDGECVWTIAASRAKNETANRLPLSPIVLDLLSQIKNLSPESKWLFPSPRGDRPVAPSAVSHAIRNNRDALGLGEITPHDLRRSAVSMMTGMGISRLVVEKIMNHKDRTVGGIYDRHSYDDEKRRALETWSTRLREIIGESSVAADKVVVPLR